MKLANPVVFDLARKLASGSGGLVSRAAGAVSREYGREMAPYNQPGENIHLEPFKPGEVSTGAVIAKLGTSLMASARSHANWQYARDQQKEMQEKSRLETQQLRQRTTGTTPETPHELAAAAAAKESSTATAAATESRFTRHEAGLATRHAEGTRAAAGNRANSKAYQAAQATLRNVKDRVSPTGTYALTARHQVAAASDSLSLAAMGNDKLARGHALALLGLPVGYRYADDQGVALREGLDYFRSKAMTDSLAAEGRRWEPTRRAAEAVTRSAGGVSGDEPVPEDDPENLFP